MDVLGREVRLLPGVGSDDVARGRELKIARGRLEAGHHKLKCWFTTLLTSAYRYDYTLVVPSNKTNTADTSAYSLGTYGLDLHPLCLLPNEPPLRHRLPRNPFLKKRRRREGSTRHVLMSLFLPNELVDIVF